MKSNPSIREMFINLTEAAVETVAMLKEKGVVFADDVTIDKRIAICQECPHLVSTIKINRCGVCGCGLALKMRLASSMCPIGKWHRVTAEEIEKI